MSKKDNLAKKLVEEEEAQHKIGDREDFSLSESIADKESLDSTNIEKIEILKSIQAKKFQMLVKAGNVSQLSPLQINLTQSEGLRVSQEKIVDLENEVDSLRHSKEELIAAGNILKDQVDSLKVKIEDSSFSREDEKVSFKDEKEVLLTALDDAKQKIDHLKVVKKSLEDRLSKDLSNIRVRETALENRLELSKLEGSILQREKTNKIIGLQSKINKLDDNLKTSYKRNKELQDYTDQLKESSRKTVSVLRVTIHNLEGYKTKEQFETQSDFSEEDKD